MKITAKSILATDIHTSQKFEANITIKKHVKKFEICVKYVSNSNNITRCLPK